MYICTDLFFLRAVRLPQGWYRGAPAYLIDGAVVDASPAADDVGAAAGRATSATANDDAALPAEPGTMFETIGKTFTF